MTIHMTYTLTNEFLARNKEVPDIEIQLRSEFSVLYPFSFQKFGTGWKQRPAKDIPRSSFYGYVCDGKYLPFMGPRVASSTTQWLVKQDLYAPSLLACDRR